MTCRTAIRGRPVIAIEEAPRPASADAVRAPIWARRIRRRAHAGFLGLLAGLLIGGIAPGAAAAEDHENARRLVDAALKDTLQVFAAPQLSRAEMTQRLRALLDRYVDLPRVGRDSLGAYWRHATQEQQAGFLALFESFLVTGYSGSVVKLGAIRFGPTSIVDSGDGVTVVQTDAQIVGGETHPVLFMVGQSDDGSYRVVDVVAAAISMSKLLNADFGAVLRNNGGRLDALIDALEHKLSVTQASGAP
jgi:phospholipid transport system substrate-binding protein